MAAPLTTLTTRAECDEALASLAAELASYQHRNMNLDYADEQATLSAQATAARLAAASALVDSYTTSLALPSLPIAERCRFEAALLTATYQKARLSARTATQTGSAAYLADVDADQVDGQVTILTTAQAAVTAHKATLPA